MAGLVIGSFLAGLLGSFGIAIAKEDWAENWPIAQVICIAWAAYEHFPGNYWAIAASAVLSFIGWLVFLWYQKSVGR